MWEYVLRTLGELLRNCISETRVVVNKLSSLLLASANHDRAGAPRGGRGFPDSEDNDSK